jgi:nitrite reductase (NADH) large subunit
VLAAGDIAEHRGVLYGNWSAAQFQGAIAGLNAAGPAASEFGGIPRSNTLKVLGLDMVSIGRFEPEAAAARWWKRMLTGATCVLYSGTGV